MWAMYVLLFLSSACLMTIELVAGRVVAPYIGVSLYTWTGIIGACLTGMSFGHLFGGWLADRGDGRRWLPRMFFLAALWTAVLFLARPGIGILADAMGSNHVPPQVGIFALCTLFFGLPCFFLAAISPLVYKLVLTTGGAVGRTVGRLAASGVAGSIAGTYATGFWLIPTFGTRAILIGITLILATLGSYCLMASPVRRSTTAMSLIMLVLFTAPAVSAHAGTRCDVESAYYCIRVVMSRGGEEGPVKKLRLDYLTHSGVRLNDPEYLWYEYEQVAGWIINAAGRPNMQALFLGGGGYILPHWVERKFPEAAVDVVEIDPAVTKVAKAEFVPNMQRVNSYHMDARLALRQMPAGKAYNIIFGDVFSDLSVPYHLTTVEFARLVRSRLAPGGLYVVNVVDRKGDGPLVNAMAATLQQAFPHVYLVPGSENKEGRGTQLLVASAEPVPWQEWAQHEDRPAFDVTPLPLPPSRFVLTDDYVPTDNLLTPVFSERWAY